MKIELFKQDVTGVIITWTIEGQMLDDSAVIEMMFGQLGGNLTKKHEVIREGKATRTIEEQMESRISSRIVEKKDKGYVASLAEAKVKKPTNQLKLKRPMLAQKFKGMIPEQYYLQLKYDGNRCLIHNNGERLIAYTREGKENPNLDHILKDIDIPVGMTIDGELYHHGTRLQTIRSWVSRKQENTLKLKYMVYDIMSDSGYSQRFEELKNLNLGESVSLAETTFVGEREEVCIGQALDAARERGYEGLIIRSCTGGYEDGKRSKHLIKVKAWESEEYTIVDIIPSKDGWAILVCITDNGTFKVSAPGPIPEKLEAYRNRNKYIGKQITVEFAYLTKKGIPSQPTAVAYRAQGE